MADFIVVMNGGHIEQLGTPSQLYEHPATAFVANFLGVSNLLAGTVEGHDGVRLGNGTLLHVAPAVLNGHTGPVSVGIRPEKLHVGGELRQLADREDHRARLRRRLDAVRSGDLRGQRHGVRPGGRIAHAGRAAGAVVRAGRRRSSFPDRRRIVHERSVHTRSGSAARACRRCVPERSRTTRCLRRRRQEGCDHLDRRDREDDAEADDVLELAALHRHQREDEVASVARRLREALRRQRQVRRGHQRQRQLLREDRRAALAEPVDRPRPDRHDRLLGPARAG